MTAVSPWTPSAVATVPPVGEDDDHVRDRDDRGDRQQDAGGATLPEREQREQVEADGDVADPLHREVAGRGAGRPRVDAEPGGGAVPVEQEPQAEGEREDAEQDGQNGGEATHGKTP